MDKLLIEGATLTPAFLQEDEEQYDKLATTLATKIATLPTSNSASKDVLAVSMLKRSATL